jgi:hypothetical protein
MVFTHSFIAMVRILLKTKFNIIHKIAIDKTKTRNYDYQDR